MAGEGVPILSSLGSGTGEFPGLRGEGTSAVRHGIEHPLTLNYELD